MHVTMSYWPYQGGREPWLYSRATLPQLTSSTCHDTFTRGHETPLCGRRWLLMGVLCCRGSHSRALALQACALKGALLDGGQSLVTKGQTQQLSAPGSTGLRTYCANRQTLSTYQARGVGGIARAACQSHPTSSDLPTTHSMGGTLLVHSIEEDG